MDTLKPVKAAVVVVAVIVAIMFLAWVTAASAQEADEPACFAHGQMDLTVQIFAMQNNGQKVELTGKQAEEFVKTVFVDLNKPVAKVVAVVMDVGTTWAVYLSEPPIACTGVTWKMPASAWKDLMRKIKGVDA